MPPRNRAILQQAKRFAVAWARKSGLETGFEKIHKTVMLISKNKICACQKHD
jgi:hypothetical protein